VPPTDTAAPVVTVPEKFSNWISGEWLTAAAFWWLFWAIPAIVRFYFHDPVTLASFGAGLAITAGWVAATATLSPGGRTLFCAAGYALLGLSSLLEIAAIATTRSDFYSGLVELLLQTNAGEARDFIAAFGLRPSYALLPLLLLLPLPLFLRLRTAPSLAPRPGRLAGAGFAILITPVLIAALFGAASPYTSYPHFRVWTALYDGLSTVARERWGGRPAPSGVVAASAQPDLLVVIVGESVARRHMSLYGYPRPTNPRLSAARDLFPFTDAVSSQFFTTASLRDALSLPGPAPRTRLIDVLNAGGFDTWWISNQSPFGMEGDPLVGLAQSAGHTQWLDRRITPDRTKWDQQAPYDEVLLPSLDSALAERRGRTAIFLHLMGCHFLYRNRYPAGPAAFTGSLQPLPVARAQTVDEYDTCILYNDSIVSRILDRVRAPGGSSAALYFSDHGDAVYDTGDDFGHIETHPTKPMTEIPLILWLSPEFQNRRPELAQQMPAWLNRPFSLADLSPTLADLAGLHYAGWSARRSLLAPDYEPLPRTVGKHLYDALPGPPTRSAP
jgi:heptose-I-phosphate ethanolaminephosphotransferase